LTPEARSPEVRHGRDEAMKPPQTSSMLVVTLAQDADSILGVKDEQMTMQRR